MTDAPVRRPPPEFRRATVVRVANRSPLLRRITVSGPELEGLDIGLPAASVRLLLPRAGEAEPAIPTWTGNEFLAADGSRPPLRTLTPMRFDPDSNELDLDVVLHGEGPLSTWANVAGPGEGVAVSGTGRGYTIDPNADAYLLAGDESALPAITLLLPALPPDAAITVIVELRDAVAAVHLEPPPGCAVRPSVDWVINDGDDPGSALVAAVAQWLTPARSDRDLKLWVAGEAASVQRIRRIAFEDLGMARTKATIRGYWKRDRAEGPGGDEG